MTEIVLNNVVTSTASAEWLYLHHPDFDGSTRIPNDPDVLAAHTARGWVVVDPPDESAPVIPDPNDGPLDDAGAWVEMVHPEFGGSQRLPNNAAALVGARDAGWVTASEATASELEGLTVADVLTAVGEDPAKAAAALAAELAGKNRSSLIRALEAIAETASPTTAAPQDEEI